PRRVPATVGAPSANARLPGTFRPPTTEVKRLTEEEMARRREKGLCFWCEEKYTPGHRCKQNFLIEFVDSDDKESVIEEEWEVEVEALNEEAEISVHAMAGIKGPRTMKLPAWLKDRWVTVLVDNGSSYNFINATLSHKLKLPTSTIEPFEVRVANGKRLRCSEMYRGVPIKFQGVTVKANLYALSLVGPDVVLGVLWLEGLGDVTTNYRKGLMKFEAGDQLITLKASEGATKEVGLKSIEK
ncbi:Eukaryotic aspartyl protease family protein, partial [Striga hermonthica]